MKRCLAALALIALGSGEVAVAAGPFDGGLLLAGDKRVEVVSERVSRDVDNRLTVADGAVEIRSGEVVLRADHVELRDETMDLTASGNVVLEAGEDRLQGEYMEFNLRSETGYVTDGEGFSGAYFFSGQRIEKLSEDRYLVKKGSFTSCEGVVPDWSFRSPDTLIHVEHYIYTKHPTMWVKKVPVLYVPYAVVPIKQDRATGLLVPRIRYHADDGLIINNSFFWAPVDQADATVLADYYSKRGWRLGLQGRYVLAENTKGEASIYHIRDRLTDSRRWEATLLHEHELPAEIRGLVNVTFRSDRRYGKDYGEELDDLSQEELDSFASLSREWGNDSVVLSAEQEESLTTEKSTTLTRFPELKYRRRESRVGTTPFFWSLGVQGAALKLERNEMVNSTTRVDTAPKLTLLWTIQSWATVKPSLELDYTWYSRDKTGEAADRFIYNPRMEIAGPKFYRIFGAEESLPRLKHLIIPKLVYNFRPEVDQDNLFWFDGLDRVGDDNSITYGLTNQVLGKFAAGEDKEPVIREVFKLDVSQSYDLDPGEGGRYLGDVKADLRVSPTENLAVDADAAFDVHGKGLASANYGLDWRWPEAASLSLERRYTRDSGVDYLEGEVTVSPGPVDFSYRGRYDLEEDLFVENRVEGKYTAQCWDFTLTYIRWEDTYEYRFLLNLKEIGTIIKF